MRSFVSTCRRVGLVRRKIVEAGRGERDHLDVQPRLVHRRDPALSHLAQPLPHLPRRDAGPRVLARGGVEPAPRRDDLVGDQVLLGADRLHVRPFLVSVPGSYRYVPYPGSRARGCLRTPGPVAGLVPH